LSTGIQVIQQYFIIITLAAQLLRNLSHAGDVSIADLGFYLAAFDDRIHMDRGRKQPETGAIDL